jgi:hypothetical protein
MKLKSFEKHSWMPNASKVAKKIIRILSHQVLNKEIEKITQLSQMGVENKDQKDSFMGHLKQLAMATLFSKDHLEANNYNSNLIKSFLEFFLRVNQSSTLDQKNMGQAHQGGDSSSSSSSSDSEDENHRAKTLTYSTLYDPFGNIIKLAEMKKEVYYKLHKNRIVKKGVDKKKFLKNCIYYTYEKGFSLNSLEYNKLFKTVIYNPEITQHYMFISKVNTYALAQTGITKKQENVHNRTAKNNLFEKSMVNPVEINKFHQIKGTVLEERYQKTRRNAIFNDMQGTTGRRNVGTLMDEEG